MLPRGCYLYTRSRCACGCYSVTVPTPGKRTCNKVHELQQSVHPSKAPAQTPCTVQSSRLVCVPPSIDRFIQHRVNRHAARCTRNQTLHEYLHQIYCMTQYSKVRGKVGVKYCKINTTELAGVFIRITTWRRMLWLTLHSAQI